METKAAEQAQQGQSANEQGTEKQRRERSTILFPYNDLDDAIEVAKAINSNVAFGTCTVDQLGPWMGSKSVSSGAFRLKLATARIFGLIDGKTEQGLTLSANGRDIVNPEKETTARVQAFLAVPLYKQVFEKYKGYMLPSPVGLERQIVELGVAKKQGDKARQSFHRSAKQAGFFAHGEDRLVMPANVMTKPVEDTPLTEKGDKAGETGNNEVKGERKEKNGPSGGGNPPSGLHPFIQGLLQKLPPEGKVWPTEQRKQWLLTAENIFVLMYPEK